MSLYSKRTKEKLNIKNVTFNIRKLKNIKAYILNTPHHTQNYNYKEMSLIAQIFKKTKKASLTVETAMVMPIFLFAFISLIYLNVVIQYTNCVEQGLHQVAKDLAVKSYAISKAEVSNEIKGKATGVLISETYVKSSVDKYLADTLMKPSSIHYFRSDFDKSDIIDLVAEEKINLPYNFLGINSFYILERARVHAWTGYDVENAVKSNNAKQEETVYITKHGRVYHRNRNCIHLKVIPKTVALTSLTDIRSSDGSKYYACEYCGGKVKSGQVYITDFGNRYHSNINCGAISRDIDTVLLSNVGSRRACKDCG